MVRSVIFKSAVVFGLTAVILGAFAAHGLHDKLSPLLLDVWKTAVQYQFYHALVLLILGLLAPVNEGKWLSRAAYLFITGIILFSGSLYAIALLSLIRVNITYIGILTPIGGLFFIAGWIQLLIAPIKTYAGN